jgi:GGDEF domain-containing protein
VKVGVSIGAVTYPNVANDAKALLQRADELMYEVKADGKNSYKIDN